MKVYNIAEAKAHLSRIVEMVYNGEEVTIAKNNLPLVDLVPHRRRAPRRLGTARGRIQFLEGFTESSEELDALFYNGPIEPDDSDR
jgi:prevent-host-death family protein